MQLTASATGRTSRTGARDADGMAVASFVLGLAGPAGASTDLPPRPPSPSVLAVVAFWRGTKRRGRARVLGLGLGIA